MSEVNGGAPAALVRDRRGKVAPPAELSACHRGKETPRGKRHNRHSKGSAEFMVLELCGLSSLRAVFRSDCQPRRPQRSAPADFFTPSKPW